MLIEEHSLDTACLVILIILGLRLYPPVSKQTPFPTKEIQLLESGLPLYAMLINTGSFALPLPTACINRKPSFKSYSPVNVVNYRPCSLQNDSAIPLKYFGTPSMSPRPLAHSLARFLASARFTIL